MDMKLEVVPVPVHDVDAAKDFYTRQVGFHLDHDVRPNENMRGGVGPRLLQLYFV
jgi:catechol 2,3-dioxygenase-like lactoylglutathione lyase family enzyme